MKFRITNIVPTDKEITAFFVFEDGTENSNKFLSSVSLVDIFQWGEKRAEELEALKAQSIKKSDSLREELEMLIAQKTQELENLNSQLNSII